MNFLTEENANKAEITSENMTEIITRLKTCSSSLKNNVLDLLKYSNSLEKLSLVLDNLKQTIDALVLNSRRDIKAKGGR